MDKYTNDEKLEYLHSVSNISEDHINIVVNSCSNIGEIISISEAGGSTFIDFVSLVKENVIGAEYGNAVKIKDRLALKKDSKGYDFVLFMIIMATLFFMDSMDSLNNSLLTDGLRNIRYYQVTAETFALTNSPSANFSELFNTWLLRIKELV